MTPLGKFLNLLVLNAEAIQRLNSDRTTINRDGYIWSVTDFFPGRIHVANPDELDSELFPTYELTIEAEDGQSSTETGTVTVNMFDSPEFLREEIDGEFGDFYPK